MTKDELIEKMKHIIKNHFTSVTGEKVASETGHQELDKLLLRYIADKRVTKIFNSAYKWYA